MLWVCRVLNALFKLSKMAKVSITQLHPALKYLQYTHTRHSVIRGDDKREMPRFTSTLLF